MNSNKFRSPLIACALLGVAAVSYIAYTLFKKNKKKSILDRIKSFYSDEQEFYFNKNFSDEESYDLVEPSDLSDFMLVEPSESLNRINHNQDNDRFIKYDKLQEITSIDDFNKDNRTNKGYKLLANPQYIKSASTSSSSRQLNNQNEKYNKDKLLKKSKKDKPETYEGWTVLDNYTNFDGYAEELTYVEKTRSWTLRKTNLFN